jgi:hypothetical protein
MENLTFGNFQDYATKTILAKAKKLLARDIEAISPNKFVAYVDEGNESYDVTIEFEKDSITNLSCDCEKGITFCVHKVTLLNLIKNKKPEKVAALKRKKTDSELILEKIDEDSLRVWVQELFKKNKDFELLFVNEFSKSEIVYDKNEIKIIIDKAIKSVIKNKKTVDATELKRIIDVLDLSLQPVLKYCKENIASPETNELLIYIYSELLEFNIEKYISGIKLVRFIEKIYKEINLFIHNIKDKEQWEVIVQEAIHFIFYKKQTYEMEMDIIYHLYENIDIKEKKQFFSNVIFDLFTVSINKNIRYAKKINAFFIKVFSENDLFEKVYMHFSPIYYENDYNVFLIEKLIEIKKYVLAEQIALEQIERNSKDKYNIGYFKVLNVIYEITKDEKKNALLKMKTIFHDFSLEKYLLIEKYCEEKEFKIFRTKLLSAFKRNFYESTKYIIAYFEIFYHDKKYKNMIDNISELTSYEMIYNYKNELFEFDKTAFLIALTNIEKHSYLTIQRYKSMPEYRDKFLVWIKENYDKTMIISVLKNKKQNHNSVFLSELENN